MKCPKCDYLGFETGDRCRNCGYDFSLLAPAAASAVTRPLASETAGGLKASGYQMEGFHPAEDFDGVDGFDRLADLPIDMARDGAGGEGAPLAVAGAGASPWVGDNGATRRRDVLPLFVDTADDQPLVRMPAAPRPPLAVRRTPDTPRVRSVVTARRRAAADDDAQLVLADEPLSVAPPRRRTRSVTGAALTGAGLPGAGLSGSALTESSPCPAGARLGAAMLDLGILFALDMFVLHFTLRMAALSWAEWRVLPLVPFVAFLLIVKVAYYWAFTAIGGQTIGKMAMRIRVVAENGIDIDPAMALRRTVMAATSVITLGLAFLPALVRGDRRAVHDHLAHTRVIARPVA